MCTYTNQDTYVKSEPTSCCRLEDYRIALKEASSSGVFYAKTIYDSFQDKIVFINKYVSELGRYLGINLINGNEKERLGFILNSFFIKIGDNVCLKSKKPIGIDLIYYDKEGNKICTDLEDFKSTRKDVSFLVDGVLDVCSSMYGDVNSIYWDSYGDDVGYSLINDEIIIRKGRIL